jgi:hypothetical protein
LGRYPNVSTTEKMDDSGIKQDIKATNLKSFETIEPRLEKWKTDLTGFFNRELRVGIMQII